MELSATVSLLLWTIALTPLGYVIYHIALFIIDLKRRGRAVDQFPHDPKHWLWGHLHTVNKTLSIGLTKLPSFIYYHAPYTDIVL